jgi:ketosteroid isomerase-like protein
MTTPAVTTTAQTAPAGSLDAVDAVARFTVAFDSRDVDAIMATMTPDCIFEDTAPPDGARHVGADTVRSAWTALFTASPDGVFTAEDTIAAGNRVVVRWRYTWKDGHVRGVDLFTIRDGLVAEKLAYVKG